MNKKILSTIIIASLIFSACTNKQTLEKPTQIQNNIENPTSNLTNDTIPTTNTTNETNQPETSRPQQFTMSDVAKHNTKNDCWFVIDNSIYDVSNFISNHPGGIIIAQGCGKDASKLFHAVENHQSKALRMLNEWKIGEL